MHALSGKHLQKGDKPAKFLEVTQFEYICFTADAFYFVKTQHAIQGHENVYGLVTFWRYNQFLPLLLIYAPAPERTTYISFF